jgi:cellulose synthase/poly-beta-1,6-N-acetylglucosamine synthase-like glycosyltransferase
VSDEKRDEPFLGPRGIEQATHTLVLWQKIAIILLILTVPAAAFMGKFTDYLFVINLVLAIFFFITTAYRVWLIDLALRKHKEIHITSLDHHNREWPRYVVQVPLYKEPRAIAKITDALSKLDYPKDRLTVQLLVEADDEETRAAVVAADIKPPFKEVLIPVSYPRTKPKACNVGLAQADGDYLVIYDAEDRPDHDQLKKAVLAFERSEERVACIQGKLNFYNPHYNFLTRCFTAEYSLWFDFCLPGLDVLQAPIPLGGTSNHFKLDVLKELKGWDEYNVTEDCDLGLRLFCAGYRTRVLDSTTWEEACSHVPSWFRQRSRWVKGYVQTWLIHTRNPFKLLKNIGLINFIHFNILIGGSFFSQLIAPIYWVLVGMWLVAVSAPSGKWPALTQFQLWLSEFFPLPVFILTASCLFLGNFLLLYAGAAACAERRIKDLIKYSPLLPLYWQAMGYSAWKGTLQLIWKPHYWEKTQHYVEGDEDEDEHPDEP